MDRREFLAAAAAPLILGAAPAFARPTGGTPLALVTADLESSVVAVDVSTGRVHPPARHARRPAQHREHRRDRRARRPHGRRPDDADRLRPPRPPDRAASSVRRATPPSRRTVASRTSPTRRREEVAVVDVRGRRVVGRVRVGGPARHLAIDRDGTRLWVALGSKAHGARGARRSRSQRRPRLVGTIRPPFLAHDVGFTPGGRRVWVTSGDRRRLAIYDDPHRQARADDRRRRAAAARHLHGRPRVRHERRRRRPARPCARRPAAALSARAGRVVQRAARPPVDPVPVALAGNALLVHRARRAAARASASPAPLTTRASSSARERGPLARTRP